MVFGFHGNLPPADLSTIFCPRMGSVSSLVMPGLAPPSEAAPEFPRTEPAELLDRCEAELAQAGLPPPLRRNWSSTVSPQHTSFASPGEELL